MTCKHWELPDYDLVELGGPITTKGKARALYSAYLGALDRETRLALALGMDRRARQVPSLAEVMGDDKQDGAAK